MGRTNNRVRGLAWIAGITLALSQPAVAQDVVAEADQRAGELAGMLAAELPCTDEAGGLLAARAAEAGASAGDLGAALGIIALGDACEPVRAAAAGVQAGLAAEATYYLASGPDTPQAETASEVLARANAEAEKRAANLRFETAPPPRNLTRTRIYRR